MENVCPVKINSRTREPNLIHKIYKGLDEANLFIADLTENNQNVFYEFGYLEARKVNGVFLSPVEPEFFYTKVKDIIQIGSGRTAVADSRRQLREALRALAANLAG